MSVTLHKRNARLRFHLFALFLAMGTVGLCSRSASASESLNFYRSLLDRGRELYAHGNDREALPLLRIAAFGTLDDVALFERAYVYIALASSRIGDRPGAVNAVARMIEAERVAPTFATLNLGADGAVFEKLARPLGFVARVPPAGQRTSAPSATAASIPSARRELENPSLEPLPPAARPQPAPPAAPPASVSPQNRGASTEPSRTLIKPSPEPGKGQRARGLYALQIAIACQESTVNRYRGLFPQLRAMPIRLGERRCFRVLIGSYATAEEARADRNAVRLRTGEAGDPVVLRD